MQLCAHMPRCFWGIHEWIVGYCQYGYKSLNRHLHILSSVWTVKCQFKGLESRPFSGPGFISVLLGIKQSCPARSSSLQYLQVIYMAPVRFMLVAYWLICPWHNPDKSSYIQFTDIRIMQRILHCLLCSIRGVWIIIRCKIATSSHIMISCGLLLFIRSYLVAWYSFFCCLSNRWSFQAWAILAWGISNGCPESNFLINHEFVN